MLCDRDRDRYSHLAVGLSNNSLCLWDVSRCHLVLEVQCAEKCLLYSMRLWGHNTNSLHVASGTIYNEIIVWKLVHRSIVPSSASSEEVCNHHDSSCSKDNRPCEKPYMAITLSRLIGHEGSIFRIAWSPDGSKLTSVSDDRRAVLVFGRLVLRGKNLVIWRPLKLMFQLALYCLDIMLEFGTVISLIL